MPIQKEIYRVVTRSCAHSWRKRFERYALVGSKCDKCNREYYPKRCLCPNCHTTNLFDVALARKGTILSTVTDYVSMMGFSEGIPYVRAIIQLDNNGPCVTSDIVDCDPESVHVGMSVEMLVRRVRRESNGNLQYAHKWRLVI